MPPLLVWNQGRIDRSPVGHGSPDRSDTPERYSDQPARPISQSQFTFGPPPRAVLNAGCSSQVLAGRTGRPRIWGTTFFGPDRIWKKERIVPPIYQTLIHDQLTSSMTSTGWEPASAVTAREPLTKYGKTGILTTPLSGTGARSDGVKPSRTCEGYSDLRPRSTQPRRKRSDPGSDPGSEPGLKVHFRRKYRGADGFGSSGIAAIPGG